VPLNIKNPLVERLAAEAARRQGVTKTEAVRRALEAQLSQLEDSSGSQRVADLVGFLERDVWPFIPAGALGRPVAKEERERILGYGDEGV
jgi:antitoxin VapB